MQGIQQEVTARMSQIDLLTHTCSQLADTVATMRDEIGSVSLVGHRFLESIDFLDALKINQETLYSRNDLLLVC